MKNFNVPLTSYELIEIFNNFPRIKGNSIKLNDFINALNSNSPSNFFIQNDPSYLNKLESNLIKSKNRIKELEKFILINSNENEDYKKIINDYKKDNKILKEKVNELNSKILEYFLFREEKNLNNPDVIQMKEKMKNFENLNRNFNKDFNLKFENFENKIENMQKNFESKKNSFEKEKEKLNNEINKINNENKNLINDFKNKENEYKNEIKNLNEKLEKYKKNFNFIKNKNENIKKENEKILNCLKDKNFDEEKIKIFVECYEEIKIILNKIEELEKKNFNREEIYKKICQNANEQQLQKEIEKINKKHEEEKRSLLKLLAQKNNEINLIKEEFNAILNELENLKKN